MQCGSYSEEKGCERQHTIPCANTQSRSADNLKTFGKWQSAKDFANKTETALEKGEYRAEKALVSDVVEQSFKVLKLSADKAKVYRQIDREFGHFALKDLKREVFSSTPRDAAVKSKPAQSITPLCTCAHF